MLEAWNFSPLVPINTRILSSVAESKLWDRHSSLSWGSCNSSPIEEFHLEFSADSAVPEPNPKYFFKPNPPNRRKIRELIRILIQLWKIFTNLSIISILHFSMKMIRVWGKYFSDPIFSFVTLSRTWQQFHDLKQSKVCTTRDALLTSWDRQSDCYNVLIFY